MKKTDVTLKTEEKNSLLKATYREAEHDAERQKLIKEWEPLDIEGWEFLCLEIITAGEFMEKVLT